MTGGDDVRVIEAIELTARRRGRRLLETVSFQVRPGQVTGLLGAPGAGKTTLLRRMLQLDPGGGQTQFGGRVFRALPHPMRTVGVVLDPLALHPGRTVSGHLRLALSADPGAAAGGRRERISAVLDVCGLTDQARTRIAELTEGMTVRLALAQALLGDPQALLLDEPDNGLEPEGQTWLTALLRAYAAQGRCVLVSGHNTDALVARADRLLVLDDGRLVGQRTAAQAARDLSGDCVIVRTPQVLRLAAVLVGAGAEPTQLDGACLEVRGLDRARIGDLAFRNDVPLHELSVRSPADDPVVAVLEACHRPAAVVPVQAPPAVGRPGNTKARVGMPFGAGAIGTDIGTNAGSHGSHGSHGGNDSGDDSTDDGGSETVGGTGLGSSGAHEIRTRDGDGDGDSAGDRERDHERDGAGERFGVGGGIDEGDGVAAEETGSLSIFGLDEGGRPNVRLVPAPAAEAGAARPAEAAAAESEAAAAAAPTTTTTAPAERRGTQTDVTTATEAGSVR
jgi:ABC-2 type transport system ATP-binding protein